MPINFLTAELSEFNFNVQYIAYVLDIEIQRLGFLTFLKDATSWFNENSE